MQGLRYTGRGLRRRNNTDKREVTLPHVDVATPIARAIDAKPSLFSSPRWMRRRSCMFRCPFLLSGMIASSPAPEGSRSIQAHPLQR